MRYFLLKEDERNPELPRVINWYQDSGIFKWSKEHYTSLPNRMLLMVNGNKNTVYADILFRPVPLVRAVVKEVLELFEPNLSFIECILMNQRERVTEEYYLPLLPEIKSSAVQKDKQNKILIRQEEIKDRVIFHAGEIQNSFSIVCRMDAVESMLRRNAVGFRLEEIIVEGVDGTWQEVQMQNI